MRILLMPLSVLTCLAIASALPVSGADPKSPPGILEAPQFLRLHRDKDGGPVAPRNCYRAIQPQAKSAQATPFT